MRLLLLLIVIIDYADQATVAGIGASSALDLLKTCRQGSDLMQPGAVCLHEAHARCALHLDSFFHHASLYDSAISLSHHDIAEEERLLAFRCPWQRWMQAMRSDAHLTNDSRVAQRLLLNALRLNSDVAKLYSEHESTFVHVVRATQRAREILWALKLLACQQEKRVHKLTPT